MKVHVYERFWMAIAVVMLGGFLAAIVFGFDSHSMQPPSHIETIDSATVTSSSEFARPGVKVLADGGYDVVVVAEMFRFLAATMTVSAGVPVHFRVATPDVLHGLQIVGTNVNTTVAPRLPRRLPGRRSRAQVAAVDDLDRGRWCDPVRELGVLSRGGRSLGTRRRRPRATPY